MKFRSLISFIVWLGCFWNGYGQRINIFAEKSDLARVESYLPKPTNTTLGSGWSIGVNQFSDTDLFFNANTMCRAVKNGTWIVVGLSDSLTVGQLCWYSEALHVPAVIASAYGHHIFLETASDAPVIPYHFNVQPETLSAVMDMITKAYNWTEAFYVTNSNTKADRAWETYSDFLRKHFVPNRIFVTFFQMNTAVEAVDYMTATVLRSTIREWKIILDMSSDLSRSLVSLLLSNDTVRERQFHFFLASLDFEGADFELLHLTSSSLTALSMLPVYRPAANATSVIITTADALAFDAINVAITTAQQHGNVASSKSLDCTAMPYDVWPEGDIVRQLVHTTLYSGLTGKVEFDQFGNRKNFRFNIMEMKDGGDFRKRGEWSDTKGLQLLNVKEPEQNKPLRVVGIITNRFLMIRPCDSTEFAGNSYFVKGPGNSTNSCYYGFVVDLIYDLAKVTNRTFTLHNSSGESYYGTKIDGTWTGAVGEVLRKEADLVIGDLSVISDREAVVDFTIPFINDGYVILMKKDATKELDIFSFLRPFTSNLWLSIVLAILGTFVIIFFVGRIAPAEWYHPSRCDPDQQEGLANDYTAEESLWLTLATLLQQGPNIEPKSVATKIAVGSWFIWAIVVSSAYTANLAAFLTVNRMKSPIQSVEDLARQDDIRYGVLDANQGSAYFFKNSKQEMYQRMWSAMDHHRTAVKTVTQAVAQVRSGKFAFIGPKTVVDYANMGKPCDTRIVGLPLFYQNYAIAVRPGSSLRKKLSEAILHLNENGRLKELEEKWFRREDCHAVDERSADEQNANELSKLSPHEMTGLFIILAAGLFISMVVAISEYMYRGRAKFRKYGISTKEVFLIRERAKGKKKYANTSRSAGNAPMTITNGPMNVKPAG